LNAHGKSIVASSGRFNALRRNSSFSFDSSGSLNLSTDRKVETRFAYHCCNQIDLANISYIASGHALRDSYYHSLSRRSLLAHGDHEALSASFAPESTHHLTCGGNCSRLPNMRNSLGLRLITSAELAPSLRNADTVLATVSEDIESTSDAIERFVKRAAHFSERLYILSFNVVVAHVWLWSETLNGIHSQAQSTMSQLMIVLDLQSEEFELAKEFLVVSQAWFQSHWLACLQDSDPFAGESSLAAFEAALWQEYHIIFKQYPDFAEVLKQYDPTGAKAFCAICSCLMALESYLVCSLLAWLAAQVIRQLVRALLALWALVHHSSLFAWWISMHLITLFVTVVLRVGIVRTWILATASLGISWWMGFRQ